ncbi:cytochrome P450 2G1-like isoform 2-T2 [Discoglossus pictus]
MEFAVNISLVLIGAFIGLLVITWWKKSLKDHSLLPPGPTPLPLIGNIFQVKPKALLQSLQKLREEHGSVYTVYFGTRPAVMLCGYNTVKEALIDHGDTLLGRGKLPLAEHILKGFGITASNGDHWKQLRRFTIMTLRNFGMGKRSLEERIQEEAQYLLERLQNTNGSSFDPTFFLSCAVSNIICSIVFGQRFEYTDKKFLSLLQNITGVLNFMHSTWGLIFFSFYKVLAHFPGPHVEGSKCLIDLRKFVEERVRKSQESFDPNAPQHFIDCFYAKMQQEKQNPNTAFHMENLVVTSVNLFFAGTETVSTTLRYGLLILLKYPKIQGKIKEEIDNVIGQQRCPCTEDRNKMLYTDAVIHEIQRFSDIIPTGLPRSTTQDISFKGYLIPKGTDVYPLLTTVLKDPEQYPDPDVFCPERFLDEQGNLKKNLAFMPFSAGKRMCPGEGLARLELFIFITSILQNFTLTSNQPLQHLDLSPDPSSAGHLPRPYRMTVLPRL